MTLTPFPSGKGIGYDLIELYEHFFWEGVTLMKEDSPDEYPTSCDPLTKIGPKQKLNILIPFQSPAGCQGWMPLFNACLMGRSISSVSIRRGIDDECH